MGIATGALVLLALTLFTTGCSPRVIVVTGTTVGLKATPGDGQTRPPQLVVGYKRAETAVIPVEGGGADQATGRDAASTVASFYLKHEWTATTEIRSFIGTGFAARKIVGSEGFAKEFLEKAPPEPGR
jgi:hypothetical protein